MSIKRSILLLLTAAMLAAPLTACQSEPTPPEGTGAVTTTDTSVTTAPAEDETPKPAAFTPDEIGAKMQTSSYRITSVTETETEGVQMKMKYVIERQSDRFRMLYDLDMGSMGKMSEELYFNTANGRVYAQSAGDWYYYVDKTVASEEMILSEIFLMVAPDVLFDNDSYDYDAKNVRYSMKRSVLAEQTGYDSADVKKVSLYLSKADDAYLIAISDGTDGSEATIRIAFASVTVKLPSATALPDEGGDEGGDIGGGEEGYVESPYIMNELLDMLEDRMYLDVDPYSVWVDGMTVWGGEGPENLFDGTITKCGGDRYSSSDTYIYFSLYEPARITAYVLNTGNDTMTYPDRNPVEWYLLGTNDAWSDGWTVLDYVWDGNLYSENFVEHGYLIDPENQGEYQHYALKLGYSSGTQFQLSEIKLFTGGDDGEMPDQGGDTVVGEVYTGAELDQMLEGLQNASELGLVNISSLHSINFDPWGGETMEYLFDGVKTYDQWYYNEDGSLKEGAKPTMMEGGGPGKCAGVLYGEACLLFALDEFVEVEMFVLTTANDNEKYLRNPYDFVIYGTNDPDAFNSRTFNHHDWTMLSLSWGGAMENINFESYGFVANDAGAFRYYCLEIQYAPTEQFQLGELELYIAK